MGLVVFVKMGAHTVIMKDKIGGCQIVQYINLYQERAEKVVSPSSE